MADDMVRRMEEVVRVWGRCTLFSSFPLPISFNSAFAFIARAHDLHTDLRRMHGLTVYTSKKSTTKHTLVRSCECVVCPRTSHGIQSDTDSC